MSVKVFYDKDVDINIIKDKTICVLGYGSQGRAHARNLTESGFKVVVALREGSKSFDICKEDGVNASPMAEAVDGADLYAFLLPDMAQAEVYETWVKPALKPGNALLFAHGFNIHYGQIVPPEDVDVIMAAPKGPGKLVRDLYVAGQGVPCLKAVYQDASGKADQISMAYASGIGGGRAGIIGTSFREETETDLFGEQAVLCGGISALMKAGFETLVEAGYAPEMAYFECINEMKLIVDLIYQGGLGHMRRFISETAKYGDITRGPRIIDENVREAMWEILEEIQSGEFAREWVLENQAKLPVYNALLKADEEHPVEEVGAKLRSMMKWL